MDIYIKNSDTIARTWSGQEIQPSAYYLIEETEKNNWKNDSILLTDITGGDAVVCKTADVAGEISDVSEAINFLLETPDIVQHTMAEAISSNIITKEDKTLYTKIHGIKADVAAGVTHTFQLVIPYGEVYFQGAEILVDIIGVSDFHIWHPTYDVSIEQYGFTVNMGTIKYVRESKYAARIPQGIIIRCDYTNDTLDTLEVGVNFLLHEIR